MRIRGVGGILAVLCIAISMGSTAQSGLLFLNEEPLSLVQPWFEQGTRVLVPLEAFGRLIGIEVSSEQGRTVLRGGARRQALDDDQVSVHDGILYVDLDWILSWVNGDIHRLGGDVYIRTDRPRLVDLDASADQVTVRLNGFSSHEVTVTTQGLSEVLLVHWPHARLDIDAQLVRVGESDIREVRLVGTSGGVSLSIVLEPGTLLATEQLETSDAYSLTLRVSDMASQLSIIAVNDGVAVHEWKNLANDVRFDYVYVDAWRDRYRLAPTMSSAGYQGAASVAANLQDNGAVAAISIECPDDAVLVECLVMNGIPYVVPDVPAEVLAIDLFGRWSVFSSLCEVDVKHRGQLIAMDGINRPLAYGEVVAYSSGYSGGIAQGIPGSFIAVKIRDERVVSVYRGPFVPEDPSAILIVASGDVKSRLSLIELGDPVDLVCAFPHAAGAYTHAVSAGPMVIADGFGILNEQQIGEIAQLTGGTLLACDWQGGLYLLSFAGTGAAQGSDDVWDLLDVLDALPTALKDAVLLSSCEPCAIAYFGVSGGFQLGSQDTFHLALSLLPLTP